MKLVFQHESGGEIWAEYDTTTRSLRERRLELDEPRPYEQLQGLYDHLDDTVVAFFRDVDGDLWLRIGVDEGNLSQGASARWERSGGRASLALVRPGLDDVVVEYEPRAPEQVGLLHTAPFVEAEDFDFGMLITNILRHPGRRARIFRSDVPPEGDQPSLGPAIA